MEKYKFLEHTADIKFQAFGKSIEECYTNAAYALLEIIKGNLAIKETTKKELKIKGTDKESLLYHFLEEFLFLLDAENFLMSKIKQLEINENILKATITGDKASEYKFTNDAKAITYNEMFVKQENKNWVCQVVMDV